MLGDDRPFELEWASVYQFACRRIDNFRYGRVIFAGDSAHQVSPFGARGANSGVQDTDNLMWKLKLVVDGDASEALIDSYHEERAFAADDNILNSTRSTDFITPKTPSSRLYRDAVLQLAHECPFARRLVNSGRLSVPTPYANSSLNTPDEEPFPGGVAPGTNAADAPVRVHDQDAWFLNQTGSGFTVLSFGPAPVEHVAFGRVQAKVLEVGKDIEDASGHLAIRYGADLGTTYLIRPDQYIAARWKRFEKAKISRALARAMAS